jgi:hypothetical protein
MHPRPYDGERSPAGAAEGLDNHQIAERFGISEKTVRNHASVIFEKIGAKSRAHVALARDAGLAFAESSRSKEQERPLRVVRGHLHARAPLARCTRNDQRIASLRPQFANAAKVCNHMKGLVGRGGFEPPTNGLKVRCSTS